MPLDLFPVGKTDTLKSIYFACLQSTMKYRIISWRKSKKIPTLKENCYIYGWSQI
jgi:hypothetical protein